MVTDGESLRPALQATAGSSPARTLDDSQMGLPVEESAHLEEWLARVNSDQRSEGVHPDRRAFDAIARWSKEHGASVSLSSPLASQIFDWYAKHTRPGSQAAKPQFIGAFYFDVSFWPVVIPVIYGTARLDPLRSLVTMPHSVVADLRSSEAWTNYLSTWLDCLDCALGLDDLQKQSTVSDLGKACCFEAVTTSSEERLTTSSLDHRMLMRFSGLDRHVRSP